MPSRSQAHDMTWVHVHSHAWHVGSALPYRRHSGSPLHNPNARITVSFSAPRGLHEALCELLRVWATVAVSTNGLGRWGVGVRCGEAGWVRSAWGMVAGPPLRRTSWRIRGSGTRMLVREADTLLPAAAFSALFRAERDGADRAASGTRRAGREGWSAV
eukprot:GGOE01041859.1.p1 GENE.GGOE01041859.1~~GGOE01041859.1.p1  ORF type:complete len:159 (+),score=6.26 GGOE01041859.1:158-634(+)